jgi:hypothetical protein
LATASTWGAGFVSGFAAGLTAAGRVAARTGSGVSSCAGVAPLPMEKLLLKPSLLMLMLAPVGQQ